MSIEILRAPNLGDILHGFLGRRGGVSTGLYAGLNVGLGSGDAPVHVTHNRALVCDAVLPGAALVTVHQIHSPEVVTVAAPIPENARPRADAMVTKHPGLLLGALAADCVPILFADATRGIVGAAHSGWKGSLAGVGEATMDAMVALGAKREDIACAIGPCIGRSSYEVSESFADPFLARDEDDARFFSQGRPGHFLFDIAGYVAARLAVAGAGSVTLMDQDTYSQPDRFYSYRRSCHLGEPDYGRQISVIGLPG